MTPPAAATAAARSDQRALRRPPGPSGPRRVSGPARGRGTAGSRRASARTRIDAGPKLTRSHARPHRLSVPASGAASGIALAGVGVLSLPGRGIRTAARSLHEPGTVADRLLRSRAWIGVVAGLLIGLVFLQVSLLKVNAGIGQSVQQASALESKNAVLRAQIAALAEDGRITLEAEKLGMLMPPADAVRYLKSSAPGGVGGAGGAVLAADAGADDAVASDGSTAGTVDDGSGDDAVATGTADDGSGDASAGYAAGDTAADDGSGTDASTDTASTETQASDPVTDDSGGSSPQAGGAVAPSAG